jgi:hypothetical protein
MIDRKTFRHSTIDHGKYLAYKKHVHVASLNVIIVDTVNVQFDIESIKFIDSIIIQMLIRSIEFHVIKANTLFLFSWIDINQLNVFFDYIRNILVKKIITMSVIRRFEHEFLLWEISLSIYISESFDD